MNITVSLICRKDKINSKNQVTPYLRFTLNRKLKYISTGIPINITDWDFDKQKLADSCPAEQEIQLISQLEHYHKKIRRLKALEIEVSFENLFESEKKKTIITVREYFQKIIKQLEELGKLNTRDKYKFTLSSLQKFRSMDIPFTEINLQFLKDYEIFLLKSNQANNSIATKFSNLKSAYNKALDDNIFICEEHAFKKFKIGSLWTPTRKRAITKNEIHILRALDLSILSKYPKPYLELARDLFMFSYLTAGINFKDIAMLRYCDIENNRIYYTRNKTQKKLTFQLLPDALKILEKYIKKDAEDDDYIFPILNKQLHITAQQKYDRIQKVRGKINTNLKIISKAMKLKHNLTTYVARHSFATILKNSGVNIALISEALGHSDLSTTQIYLDSFENEQVDAAMSNLL